MGERFQTQRCVYLLAHLQLMQEFNEQRGGEGRGGEENMATTPLGRVTSNNG